MCPYMQISLAHVDKFFGTVGARIRHLVSVWIGVMTKNGVKILLYSDQVGMKPSLSSFFFNKKQTYIIYVSI